MPLLSAINEAGGGVAFTNEGVSDGGYFAKHQTDGGKSYNIGNDLKAALDGANFYVVVTDVMREIDKQVEVVGAATY